MQLIPYLDGSRDHVALLDLLDNWVKEGSLTLNLKHQQTGELLSLSGDNRRDVLTKLLDDALQQIAQAALLIA
ncbi:hypothetical protein QUF82_07210 [Thiotrichales bacterium HSG14]|nr:hypothetical protein [Thiotrichales bacterium HSG14]